MSERDKDEKKDRLIQRKMDWAREKRGLSAQAREGGEWSRQNPGSESDEKPRLPPGQRQVAGFPVLDLGVQPDLSLETWSLEINGLVENPVVWEWRDFMTLPQTQTISDFHCVTTWSTFDNRWEGVLFRDVLREIRPKPEAAHVLFSSYDGYTTNLPLSVLDAPDVLIAHRWNDQPLSREHGGPARIIVPKLYAWKGAKWVKTITFESRDRPGYWEVRGYSNTADPWTEDRYA